MLQMQHHCSSPCGTIGKPGAGQEGRGLPKAAPLPPSSGGQPGGGGTGGQCGGQGKPPAPSPPLPIADGSMQKVQYCAKSYYY